MAAENKRKKKFKSAPDNAEKQRKTPPAEKHRLRNFLLWFCVLTAGFLVLTIGPRKIFSRSERMSELEERDLQAVLTKFSESLTDREGNLQTRATVYFSPGELNAMVHALIYVLRKRGLCPELAFDGDWNRSMLGVYGSYYLPANIPAAVNFNVNATPDLRDGKLSVHVVSAGIGFLPLPGFAVDSAVTALVEKLTAEPQTAQILQLFSQIRVMRDGSLEVVFSPRQIGAFTDLLSEGAARPPHS